MTGISIWCTILNIIFNSVPVAIWYSAIPGVTIGGLFLASFIALRLGTKKVLFLFTAFLCLDFLQTIWNQEVFHWPYVLKSLVIYGLAIFLMVMHIKIFKKNYKELGTGLGRFEP